MVKIQFAVHFLHAFSTYSADLAKVSTYKYLSIIYFFFSRYFSQSLEVMDGHRSRVFGVCFNPRSSHELISGGWDNTIQFWDIRQPYALRRISGAHICGDALDISRNGKEVYVLVSRIQKSKVVSTLTRSYSYGNVYKNCRSSFF